MLVLALPAKSFQLYFNFIQSAAPPPLLPPRVIAYFRTNGGGWKEKGTCIVIINYSRGTETDRERERDHARLSISPQQRRLFHSARNRGKFMTSPCTPRVSRS